MFCLHTAGNPLVLLTEDMAPSHNHFSIQNTTAMAIVAMMARRDEVTAKSKHLEVKCYHIRALRKSGVVLLQHIATANQLANFMKKVVGHGVRQPSSLNHMVTMFFCVTAKQSSHGLMLLNDNQLTKETFF